MEEVKETIAKMGPKELEELTQLITMRKTEISARENGECTVMLVYKYGTWGNYGQHTLKVSSILLPGHNKFIAGWEVPKELIVDVQDNSSRSRKNVGYDKCWRVRVPAKTIIKQYYRRVTSGGVKARETKYFLASGEELAFQRVDGKDIIKAPWGDVIVEVVKNGN